MLDASKPVQVGPISEAERCGEPLDYDLAFLDLEIIARGRPERQTGDAVVPGEGPDWSTVWTQGTALTERSHDLRVELFLARAALNRDGPTALAERLLRVAALVGTFWPELHPCPEDDDEDETVRLNALAEFASPAGLLGDLRNLDFVESRRAGSFSIRDWHSACHDEAPTHTRDQILGALSEAQAETLDTFVNGVRAVQEALGLLDTSVRNHVALPDLPDLSALDTVLHQIVDLLGPYLSVESAADDGTEVEGGAAPRPSVGPRGGPNSRDDIVTMLDGICRWYRQNEPASPVPILLERARQLVAKDFLTLLQELAPDGTTQFRHLAGLPATTTSRNQD